MIHSRWIAALASICAIAVALPVFAAQTWMAQVVDQPSRFSGPGVYVGKPALPVTLSMIIAGGGPSNFKTLTLVKALAGAKTDAEVASLTKKFGSAKVTHFVTIFPFVISDSLKIVKAKGVALPSAPNPDPKNGKALAGALWAAGQTGRRPEWDAARPLAELVHEKTGGNPFFAIQFLRALAEEGLLRFDSDTAAWLWDLERIRAKAYTDNVVDLMVGKLKRLSGATQAALQQLACLGNRRH